MYSEEQYQRALQVYDETGSVTKTITFLGYPTRRQTLYNWINRRNHLPQGKSTFRGVNTPEHPRHAPLALKMDVLQRCFENGEDVQAVSNEVGYSTASIYSWRKKYLQKGRVALMPPGNDRKRGPLTEGSVADANKITEMQATIDQMQLEIDILKETIEVLKKDPGVNLEALKNSEKAVIVDALKSKYTLPQLLNELHFPKSSFYYQLKRKSFEERHVEDAELIENAFKENRSCYGYRRIKAVLSQTGIRISEKVIRRIMREKGLNATVKRRRKYNSYKGEISPAPPNLLDRNFSASEPNQKWLTDITEFAIPDGKIYLSPMIDCFDGMPVAWNIGTSPDSNLVNNMLDDAIATLRQKDHPIVHTDRGCHYRWDGWISRMESSYLIRSMSKKACSPDNSACEGFFGSLKNEFFYGRSWQGIGIETFIEMLNEYLIWYRDKRIKMSLEALSPMQYRIKLGWVQS